MCGLCRYPYFQVSWLTGFTVESKIKFVVMFCNNYNHTHGYEVVVTLKWFVCVYVCMWWCIATVLVFIK